MWFTILAAAWADPGLADGTCTCFVGETRGNDVVAASFRLCREGERVMGGFDWTGAASGRSFRRLEGTLEGDRLALHDTAMPLDRPVGGWRFCGIDHYRLTLGADGGLTGTYDSAACVDHASVALRPTTCPGEPQPAAPGVKGPAPALVPDEVQSCRSRGYLWLSDPDYYEKTEIETEAGWQPVWQVLDRQGGRAGYLLVYPESCRVVVGIAAPAPGAEPTFELVPPPGSAVTPAEKAMLERWARRW